MDNKLQLIQLLKNKSQNSKMVQDNKHQSGSSIILDQKQIQMIATIFNQKQQQLNEKQQQLNEKQLKIQLLQKQLKQHKQILPVQQNQISSLNPPLVRKKKRNKKSMTNTQCGHFGQPHYSFNLCSGCYQDRRSKQGKQKPQNYENQHQSFKTRGIKKQKNKIKKGNLNQRQDQMKKEEQKQFYKSNSTKICMIVYEGEKIKQQNEGEQQKKHSTVVSDGNNWQVMMESKEFKDRQMSAFKKYDKGI